MFGGRQGRLPSGNNPHFAQIPSANIPRSSFNRTHTHKTTFDSGFLIPIFLDEALPGDSFSLSMTTFARLSTPIVPVMDNLYADVFFFSVPMRLVWENWERFNGAQDNPDDSTDFLIPIFENPGSEGDSYFDEGSIQDYFGLPVNVAGLLDTPSPLTSPVNPISCLPFRAYNLIWNEWFRDQNTQDSVVFYTSDGPDDPTEYTLLRRNKRHDYFTSALPWPQKGPDVLLPLGDQAPVYGQPITNGDSGHIWQGYQSLASPTIAYGQMRNTQVGGLGTMLANTPGTAGWTAATFEYEGMALGTPAQYTALGGTLQPPYADLSNATAATINQIREAFQLQKLFERDARGGTRYVEVLLSHFGVVSPDFRLQRPEYLGGGSTQITMAPIPQTSAVSGQPTPPGTLSAMGYFSHKRTGFHHSFVEHCLVIGLISVRADMTYQNSINRMWTRRTRYDFYWPALAHLGEQAVYNRELYASGNSVPANLDIDAEVFGYQERYAEYRYKPSMITGQFRSVATPSLDIWHLSQEFAAVPEILDPTWLEERPPVQRVLAVQSPYPEFLMDAHFDFKCARPMPTYAVPGLVDHF